MDPTNLPPRSTPHWSLYQREQFVSGTKDEKPPPFNTAPDQLEKLAHEKLSAGGWSYASCNAGIGDTHRANREAFRDWRIIPRMLVDTNRRDTTVEVFGRKLSAPIAFSPIGINKIYHPEGELPVARVAGELGLPYSLSTAGSAAIEDAGEHNVRGAAHGVETQSGAQSADGLRWFQLYLPHDDELAISLLERAHESGFDACIMTLDTWQLAWRHNDIALSNYAFFRGVGCDLGFSDPVFRRRLEEMGIDINRDPKAAGRAWIDSIWHGKAHDWNKAAWAREQWRRISGNKPFLVKGIQCVEDAKRALDMGCEGIVVSNHAGRQVDGAVGSLEMLPAIAQAVGDKMVVCFDSGVRCGADVFKALALGAKVVMVGRLWVYGLSIQGEVGVRHVMKSLLAEFDLLMHLSGHTSVADIRRESLRHVSELPPRL
ncbi:unnamed protein product [Parajaminaea phylloscopi]